jgi:hypothetical protein
MGVCNICREAVPDHELTQHLEDEHSEELGGDRYRWCIHCGADCWLEEENQEHGPECPVTTGRWPFTAADFEHGCLCGQCDYAFQEGDVYALIDSSTGQPAARPHIGEIVCMDCALNAFALGN